MEKNWEKGVARCLVVFHRKETAAVRLNKRNGKMGAFRVKMAKCRKNK